MTDTKKAIVLDPKTRELADLLKAKHKLTDDRLEFEGTDAIFSENLMPLDELVKAQEAQLKFATAVTLATGELSQDRMVKDANINRTTSRVNLGVGRIEATHDRKVSGTAAGREWTKFGRASCDIKVGTGTSTRGYRDVVEHLAREGESVFSN